MKDRNENRLGYKPTKVGWIPEEWSEVNLKDICDQPLSGYSVTGSERPAGQGEYGVLKLSCIHDGLFVPGENKLVNGDEISKLKTPVKRDTLLVSRSNTEELVGAVCYVACETQNIFLSDLIWEVFAKDKSMVNMKWLAYLLCSKPYRAQITARANGTSGSMKKITKPNFLGIHINLPLLQEQEKMVEILTIWDQAINETRLLIEAKKRLKKSLMQHLLTGKRRLPGFARSGDRKSYPFFDLPEDWECPQLIEIAQECLERNPGGNNLPAYTCSKYHGFIKSSEYFGKKVLSVETSFHKVIKPGWFGYPSNHIEEGSIGLLLNHEAGLVSPIYVVFKCDDSIDPEFLYAVFKTEIFRHIFARSTNASVDRRGSLRWKEFSLIRVPKPPSEEQREIVKVLKVADEEIHQVEAKLKTIETQKRGLMQKLLTGEVRANLSHFR